MVSIFFEKPTILLFEVPKSRDRIIGIQIKDIANDGITWRLWYRCGHIDGCSLSLSLNEAYNKKNMAFIYG